MKPRWRCSKCGHWVSTSALIKPQPDSQFSSHHRRGDTICGPITRWEPPLPPAKPIDQAQLLACLKRYLEECIVGGDQNDKLPSALELALDLGYEFEWPRQPSPGQIGQALGRAYRDDLVSRRKFGSHFVYALSEKGSNLLQELADRGNYPLLPDTWRTRQWNRRVDQARRSIPQHWKRLRTLSDQLMRALESRDPRDFVVEDGKYPSDDLGNRINNEVSALSRSLRLLAAPQPPPNVLPAFWP